MVSGFFVALRAATRISFKSRKKGAVDGLKIGALIVLPVAVMNHTLSGGYAGYDSAVFHGGLGGIFWGAIIGALVQSRVTYVFIAPRTVETPAGGWIQ